MTLRKRPLAIESQAIYNFVDEENNPLVVTQEYGTCPKGVPFLGAWVMRKYRTGEYVDHDMYRDTLAERQHLTMCNKKV